MEENTNQEQEVNPKRSPFTKPDNKRVNLHSPDIDRVEIAEGDPGRDFEDERELLKGPAEKARDKKEKSQ